MLRGLRTVCYPAPDLARSKAFYSEVLGIAPYFDQPFYVGFDVSGFELGLVPDAVPGTSGPIAYWAVADLPAALAKVEAAGGKVLEPPTDVGGGILTASATDPAGNRLGLIVNPSFRAEVGSRMATTGAGTSARTVVVERTVTAGPDEIWALWTTSEGLAKWLVPSSKVELRVGGPYEFYFDIDQPVGLRGGEDNVVLAFLAPRLLTFTWNAPPDLRTRDEHTQVVLELTAVPDGTQVRLTHTGWPTAGLEDLGTDWSETLAYFERAWASVLTALERHTG